MSVIKVNSWARLQLIVAAGLAGLVFCWPLLVPASAAGWINDGTAGYLIALVLPLLLAMILVQVSSSGLDPKAIAILGVLAAVGAVLRPLGAGTAGIETVFFLLVLGGRVFGPGFGFLLGAITLFASAILTGGVGAWLPYQMLAAAWVGFGAGMLPKFRGKAEIFLLVCYGAIAGLAYGLAMNLWSWPAAVGVDSQLSFVPGAPVLQNLGKFLIWSFSTSLGWDLGRALTNMLLIGITATPVLATLRRAARRAAFE